MQTSKLRKFASYARKALIEQVGTRMKSVLAEGSLARRENAKAVADLEAKIKDIGREGAVEQRHELRRNGRRHCTTSCEELRRSGVIHAQGRGTAIVAGIGATRRGAAASSLDIIATPVAEAWAWQLTPQWMPGLSEHACVVGSHAAAPPAAGLRADTRV